jgi:hypothetical protein
MNFKAPEGKRLTHYSPNTNFKVGTMELSFSYKREDLQIKNTSEVKRFFSPLESSEQKIFLLNSAQVGITLLCYYFKNYLGIERINLDKMPYVGTTDCLSFFDICIEQTNSELYWIDSSNCEFEKVKTKLKNHWEIVVIDSTCWSLNESQFKEILNSVRANEIFIVRSVSKLDMGGVEYGSFGSLIYLNCVRDKSQTMFEEQFEKMYKMFGCAPSLCDISPALTQEKFYRQNLNRCQKIAENTKRLQVLLSDLPQNNRPVFYEHGKFFTILLPEHIVDIEGLKIKKLEQLLTYYKIEHRFVRSFGFNFWNLDVYKVEESNRYNLRICSSSTANEQELEMFSNALKTYLAVL